MIITLMENYRCAVRYERLAALAAFAYAHDEDYGEVFYRERDDTVYVSVGDGGDYDEEFVRRAKAYGFKNVRLEEEGCFPDPDNFEEDADFVRVPAVKPDVRTTWEEVLFARKAKAQCGDHGQVYIKNDYSCNLYLVTSDNTEEAVVQQLITDAKEMGYTLDAEAEVPPKGPEWVLIELDEM